MNPFGKLSEDNQDQIRKYLRFFRQKKEGILRNVSNEFSEAKSDRLKEDMFSRDDMEEYSDYLRSAIRVHIFLNIF